MKITTICIMLLILSAKSYCQQNQSSKPLTREEYLKKSKTQKIVGFVFLGAGAITLFSVSRGRTDFSSIGIIAALGGILTIASIPQFKASARNKRKAKDAPVSFNIKNIQYLKQSQLSFQTMPAITLNLNL